VNTFRRQLTIQAISQKTLLAWRNIYVAFAWAMRPWAQSSDLAESLSYWETALLHL